MNDTRLFSLCYWDIYTNSALHNLSVHVAKEVCKLSNHDTGLKNRIYMEAYAFIKALYVK